MLTKNKYIIWISKKTLRLYSIGVAGHSLFTLLKEMPWSMETLGPMFLSLRNLIKGEIRILVDDDLVYTFCVEAPTSKNAQRAEMLAKIEELVPEDMNNTIWDYKEGVEINGKKYSEVMVLLSDFYDTLHKAIFDAKISVEAIEPLSYTLLGGIIPNVPFVLIYKHDSTLMAVVYKKSVLWTKIINKFDLTEFRRFVDFTKVRFGIDINQVIVSAEMNLEEIGTLEKFEVRQTMLNPVLDIAVRADIHGKDADVLNVRIIENAEKEAKNHKLVIGAFAVGIVVLISTLFLILRLAFNPKTRDRVIETPVVTETTESTQSTSSTNEQNSTNTSTTPEQNSEPNFDIKIQILNGTKVPGLAKKLADEFTAAGYTTIVTGNSPGDHLTTDAKLKNNLDTPTTNSIDTIIKKSYPLYTSSTSEEVSEYDLVIIIGSKE